MSTNDHKQRRGGLAYRTEMATVLVTVLAESRAPADNVEVFSFGSCSISPFLNVQEISSGVKRSAASR